MFFIISCNDNSTIPVYTLPAKPVVTKTSMNYNAESFRDSFPENISLQNISTAYKNNYSEAVINAINDYMKSEVISLNEDVNVFDNILLQTGCKNSEGYRLPTYAERAKFENQEVWIFQLTYGLGQPSFGHFKCFAFSVETLDTLCYVGCK